MFLKALLFAILGVSLVLSFPAPEHNEISNEILHPDGSPPVINIDNKSNVQKKKCPVKPKKDDTALPEKHSRWQRAKEKFLSLKQHCHNFYEKVINELHDIKEGTHTIKKNLSKAKNETLKLVNDVEAVYKRIIVDGEYAFHEFDRIYKDLKLSIETLKTDGEEFYHEIKKLLDELKLEIIEAKDAIVSGELEKLHNSWHNMKKKWGLVKTKFDSMYEKALEMHDKTKTDYHVVVNGVRKSMRDVKIETDEIMLKAKRTYKDIVVNGKNSYVEFNKSYESLMNILQALEPGADKIDQELKGLLFELSVNILAHEQFVKLKAAPIAIDNDEEPHVNLVLLSTENNNHGQYSVDH